MTRYFKMNENFGESSLLYDPCCYVCSNSFVRLGIRALQGLDGTRNTGRYLKLKLAFWDL